MSTLKQASRSHAASATQAQGAVPEECAALALALKHRSVRPRVPSLSLSPQAQQQGPDDRILLDQRAPMLTAAHILPGNIGPVAVAEFHLRVACPCPRQRPGSLQPNKALTQLASQV